MAPVPVRSATRFVLAVAALLTLPALSVGDTSDSLGSVFPSQFTWDECAARSKGDFAVTICLAVASGQYTVGFSAQNVSATRPLTWVGVGVSVSGGMKGADMMIATRTDEGAIEVGDYWSEGYFAPTKDAIDDVTTLASGESSPGNLWFVATKPLRQPTCEGSVKDLDLISVGGVAFIYALGVGDEAGPFVYHGSNRGLLDIHLGLGDVPRPSEVTAEINPPNTQSTVFQVHEQVIPTTPATTYICKLVALPTEPRLVTEIDIFPSTELVHHMLLLGCNGEAFEDALPGLEANPNGQFECEGDEMVPAGCQNVIWGWGGVPGRVAKEKIGNGHGMPIGHFSHAILQIHYNNPQSKPGVLMQNDSLILTHVPLETPGIKAVGMLMVGVAPYSTVDSIVIPPGRGAVLIDTICPIECTRALPEAGVEIMFAFEHAHRAGRSLGMEIHRGDEIIPITHLSHWDYDMAGFPRLKPLTPSARLMPGDRLRKWCTFDSRGYSETIYGGQRTADEMCFAFLVTFPPTPFSACIDLQDAPLRFNYGLHAVTPNLPASCPHGASESSDLASAVADLNKTMGKTAGEATNLANIMRDKTSVSAFLRVLGNLTFYDPVANQVDLNPQGRCGPTIPGALSKPPIRVSDVNVLNMINFAESSSICGPGNRETSYACPPPSAITVSVAYWGVSVAIAFVVLRTCFRRLKLPRAQRNVVAYFMNLLVTTPACLLVLIYAAPLLFRGDAIDNHAQKMSWFFGFFAVWMLYIWELVYRVDINPSLLAHHMCTIALCLAFSISLYDIEVDLHREVKRTIEAMLENESDKAAESNAVNDTRQRVYLTVFRLGLITILTALTEQASFIALLMHRATHPKTHLAFRISAIWSGFSKTALFLWGMGVYGVERDSVVNNQQRNKHCDDVRWCRTWEVLYPVLYSLLYATQIWATYILHALSKRRLAQKNAGVEGRGDDGANSATPDSARRFSGHPSIEKELEMIQHEYDPMYLAERKRASFASSAISAMPRSSFSCNIRAADQLADAMSSRQGQSDLRDFFSSLDTDGDGKISQKEWGHQLRKNKKMMLTYFVGASPKEVAATFKDIDIDGDGQLSWDEFTSFFAKKEAGFAVGSHTEGLSAVATREGERSIYTEV